MVETIKESTKRETKLERERERVLTFFCHEQLGKNGGEMWKWSKNKFIRKLRCKRKGWSRLKVENLKKQWLRKFRNGRI